MATNYEEEIEKKMVSSPLLSTPLLNKRAFEELDDEEEEYDGVTVGRKQEASAFATGGNLLKSYLGSGILGLPYAFSQGGVVATTIILSMIGGIATHTMLLLVQTRNKCNAENKRVITYGDIADYLLGKWGKYLLNSALIFTQFGFCCVYIVFCIDNTSSLLCSFGLGTINPGGDTNEPPCTPSINEKFWVLPWFFIFTLLSWIRTLSGVAYVSNFANTTTFIAMVAIYSASIIQILYKVEDPEVPLDVDVSPPLQTTAVMLSLGIYAFEGIGTVLPSVTAMKKPEKFPSVLVFVMVFSTVNYVLFGLLPYLAFGRNTSDEVTDNLRWFSECYPPDCTTNTTWVVIYYFVTILLIMTIMGTFPMQMFIIIDIGEDWIFNSTSCAQYQHTVRIRKWIKNVFRTSLVLLACLVAVAIPDFGLLIALVGSLGSSSLQFIFPVLFVLKMEWHEISLLKKSVLLFYLAFGTFAALFGFSQTVMELATEFSQKML